MYLCSVKQIKTKIWKKEYKNYQIDNSFQKIVFNNFTNLV